MTTSRHARSGLLLVPVFALFGCGSSDEPPAPEPSPRPAARPAPKLLASYAGTWTRDDGVVFEVTDEAGAVKGALQSDPAGRWRSVEFTLSREQETLRGLATVALLEPEAELEVRWELVPEEGGALSGRLQTAWVDDAGDLVLFPDDPEWRIHRFDVKPPAAPAPEPAPVAEEPTEPEPEPAVAEQPVEPEPEPAPTEPEPEPAVVEQPEPEPVEPEPAVAEQPVEPEPTPVEPEPAVAEQPSGPSAEEQARAEADAARRAEEEQQTQLALAAVEAEESRLDEELEAARERWTSDRAARAEAGRARRDARLRHEAEEQARREAEEQARREAEEQAAQQPGTEEQPSASAETTEPETTPAPASPSDGETAATPSDGETAATPSDGETAATPAGESPDEQARREAEAQEAARLAAEEQARREQEEAEARRRQEEEERARQAALAQGAPDPEEAKRLAEEQARRDAQELERRQELEKIRERRRTPEGLAQVLFDAMKGLEGELFAACWIDAQDAQHLFGARGMEQAQLVRRARNDAWNAHRRESVHAELQRATFVRADVPTRSGRKGSEVQNGQIVYRVDGEEKTIPLGQLYEVADGSWKAARMLP